MKGDSYANIILENINSKFDRLIEVVANMQEQIVRMADKEDITSLSQRIGILEYSVRQTLAQLEAHDTRIRSLESPA